MKHITILFATAFSVLFVLACRQVQQPQSPKAQSIESYFKPMQAKDTLLFQVVNDQWATGDTMPNGLFFSQMETRIMNHVPYFDNSGELVVLAAGRFALQDSMEAYLVNMLQGWYRHQSLFVFDQKKQAFTDRITVADFYGGDGGQILTGSYLLDYDGDGDRDIVQREIEHWLDVSGDEPSDKLAESATLLLWDGAGFKTAAADSATLIKAFPIESMW
jgi:hypothetical protein